MARVTVTRAGYYGGQFLKPGQSYEAGRKPKPKASTRAPGKAAAKKAAATAGTAGAEGAT